MSCKTLSYTRSKIIQLQAMLDICVRFGDEMDIKFNAKKSCLFKVGRNYKDLWIIYFLAMMVLIGLLTWNIWVSSFLLFYPF